MEWLIGHLDGRELVVRDDPSPFGGDLERVLEIVVGGRNGNEIVNNVGGAFLAVDPQEESLVPWYERLGFIRLSADRRRMVLPFHRIP